MKIFLYFYLISTILISFDSKSDLLTSIISYFDSVFQSEESVYFAPMSTESVLEEALIQIIQELMILRYINHEKEYLFSWVQNEKILDFRSLKEKKNGTSYLKLQLECQKTSDISDSKSPKSDSEKNNKFPLLTDQNPLKDPTIDLDLYTILMKREIVASFQKNILDYTCAYMTYVRERFIFKSMHNLFHENLRTLMTELKISMCVDKTQCDYSYAGDITLILLEMDYFFTLIEREQEKLQEGFILYHFYHEFAYIMLKRMKHPKKYLESMVSHDYESFKKNLSKESLQAKIQFNNNRPCGETEIFLYDLSQKLNVKNHSQSNIEGSSEDTFLPQIIYPRMYLLPIDEEEDLFAPEYIKTTKYQMIQPFDRDQIILYTIPPFDFLNTIFLLRKYFNSTETIRNTDNVEKARLMKNKIRDVEKKYKEYLKNNIRKIKHEQYIFDPEPCCPDNREYTCKKGNTHHIGPSIKDSSIPEYHPIVLLEYRKKAYTCDICTKKKSQSANASSTIQIRNPCDFLKTQNKTRESTCSLNYTEWGGSPSSFNQDGVERMDTVPPDHLGMQNRRSPHNYDACGFRKYLFCEPFFGTNKSFNKPVEEPDWYQKGISYGSEHLSEDTPTQNDTDERLSFDDGRSDSKSDEEYSISSYSEWPKHKTTYPKSPHPKRERSLRVNQEDFARDESIKSSDTKTHNYSGKTSSNDSGDQCHSNREKESKRGEEFSSPGAFKCVSKNETRKDMSSIPKAYSESQLDEKQVELHDTEDSKISSTFEHNRPSDDLVVMNVDLPLNFGKYFFVRCQKLRFTRLKYEYCRIDVEVLSCSLLKKILGQEITHLEIYALQLDGSGTYEIAVNENIKHLLIHIPDLENSESSSKEQTKIFEFPNIISFFEGDALSESEQVIEKESQTQIIIKVDDPMSMLDPQSVGYKMPERTHTIPHELSMMPISEVSEQSENGNLNTIPQDHKPMNECGQCKDVNGHVLKAMVHMPYRVQKVSGRTDSDFCPHSERGKANTTGNVNMYHTEYNEVNKDLQKEPELKDNHMTISKREKDITIPVPLVLKESDISHHTQRDFKIEKAIRIRLEEVQNIILPSTETGIINMEDRSGREVAHFQRDFDITNDFRNIEVLKYEYQTSFSKLGFEQKKWNKGGLSETHNHDEAQKDSIQNEEKVMFDSTVEFRTASTPEEKLSHESSARRKYEETNDQECNNGEIQSQNHPIHPLYEVDSNVTENSHNKYDRHISTHLVEPSPFKTKSTEDAQKMDDAIAQSSDYGLTESNTMSHFETTSNSKVADHKLSQNPNMEQSGSFSDSYDINPHKLTNSPLAPIYQLTLKLPKVCLPKGSNFTNLFSLNNNLQIKEMQHSYVLKNIKNVSIHSPSGYLLYAKTYESTDDTSPHIQHWTIVVFRSEQGEKDKTDTHDFSSKQSLNNIWSKKIEYPECSRDVAGPSVEEQNQALNEAVFQNVFSMKCFSGPSSSSHADPENADNSNLYGQTNSGCSGELPTFVQLRSDKSINPKIRFDIRHAEHNSEENNLEVDISVTINENSEKNKKSEPVITTFGLDSSGASQLTGPPLKSTRFRCFDGISSKFFLSSTFYSAKSEAQGRKYSEVDQRSPRENIKINSKERHAFRDIDRMDPVDNIECKNKNDKDVAHGSGNINSTEKDIDGTKGKHKKRKEASSTPILDDKNQASSNTAHKWLRPDQKDSKRQVDPAFSHESYFETNSSPSGTDDIFITQRYTMVDFNRCEKKSSDELNKCVQTTTSTVGTQNEGRPPAILQDQNSNLDNSGRKTRPSDVNLNHDQENKHNMEWESESHSKLQEQCALDDKQGLDDRKNHDHAKKSDEGFKNTCNEEYLSLQKESCDEPSGDTDPHKKRLKRIRAPKFIRQCLRQPVHLRRYISDIRNNHSTEPKTTIILLQRCQEIDIRCGSEIKVILRKKGENERDE